MTTPETTNDDDHSLSRLMADIAACLGIDPNGQQAKAIEEMIDDHMLYWVIS